MLRMLMLLSMAFVQTLRARWAQGPLLPSWTFKFEWIVRFLRVDWDASASLTFAEQRRELDGRFYPRAFARKARISEDALGGIAVRRFVPPGGARDTAAVLAFHGGSFIYGSSRSTHEEFFARIAIESKFPVFAVEYRLAPEHPFPAALDDLTSAFDALVASGVAPERVILLGDSAGANLALALAVALRDRGGPRVAGMVLLSPWVDLTMPGASYESNAAFDYGTRAVLEKQAHAYAGSLALSDPRVSPTFASLSELPPTFVQYGSAELLRDDIVALATKLTESGISVTLDEAREMPHNPCLLAALHPMGAIALARACAFISSVI